MTDTVDTVDVDAIATAPDDREPVVSRRGRKLLAAIIIILILALVGISVLLVSLVAPRGGVADREEAGGAIWVRSIYGWGDTPDTQFVAPQELFIADDGTIWVTDAQYKTAFAFNPEGKLVDVFGENTEEPVIGMGPVAVGPEGRLFVGEGVMDRVRVYDANDTEIGIFAFPNAIDIDYRDDVMVIGTTVGFAIVDPLTGEPRQLIGTRGKGVGEFDTVNGTCIGPDGTIYVTDAYNNRLSAYDADGENLWTVSTGAPANEVDLSGGGAMANSTETSAPAELQLPADVTMDGNGRLVVVDSLDFSIAVFDAENGDFIAKYGEYGALDGQFVYPSSIDYDPARNWFAVADSGNSRVQLIRIPGSGGALEPVAALRRSLSGPLRACIAPLALLLVLLVVMVLRRRKRRAQERAGHGVPAQAVALDSEE